jgi:hypothetical protein
MYPKQWGFTGHCIAIPLRESGSDILTVQGIPQLSDEKTALIK